MDNNMKKLFLLGAMVCALGITGCIYTNDNPRCDPNDTNVFYIVEREPEFPGGIDSMFAFLNRNIRYPQAAIEKNIEGKVYVQFVVEQDGSITNAHILRDIVYGSKEADELAAELGCGAEVIRVVNTMPKWKPAVQHGWIVRSNYTLPVGFYSGQAIDPRTHK